MQKKNHYLFSRSLKIFLIHLISVNLVEKFTQTEVNHNNNKTGIDSSRIRNDPENFSIIMIIISQVMILYLSINKWFQIYNQHTFYWGNFKFASSSQWQFTWDSSPARKTKFSLFDWFILIWFGKKKISINVPPRELK